MKRLASIWILSMFVVCLGFAHEAQTAEPKKGPPAVNPAPVLPAKGPASVLPAKGKVAVYTREISVTIKADPYQGSGVKVVKGDTTYILTAGHVIEHLRRARRVVDSTGSSKMQVEYDNPEIFAADVQDGETVGGGNQVCTVVTVSGADFGEDLAVLRVKKKNYATKGAVFYKRTKDNPIPEVGTKLYHCGSLLGEFGHNSVIDGIVSSVGRVYEKKIYDQTNLNIFPGSSGGGVYIQETGEYCGMIVRGTTGGFNFMVPQRRIEKWAKRMKIEWLLDANAPAPSEEELAKIVLEDPEGPPTDRGQGQYKKLATKTQPGFMLQDMRQGEPGPLLDLSDLFQQVK